MTSNKITESAIEEFAIELLEKQGYRYLYAPDIAPDGELIRYFIVFEMRDRGFILSKSAGKPEQCPLT